MENKEKFINYKEFIITSRVEMVTRTQKPVETGDKLNQSSVDLPSSSASLERLVPILNGTVADIIQENEMSGGNVEGIMIKEWGVEGPEEFESPDKLYRRRREQWYREAKIDPDKEIIDIGDETQISEGPKRNYRSITICGLEIGIEYKWDLYYPMQRLLISKDLLKYHIDEWITEKSILSGPIKKWDQFIKNCNLMITSITLYRCASQPKNLREYLCGQAPKCAYRNDDNKCMLSQYLDNGPTRRLIRSVINVVF